MSLGRAGSSPVPGMFFLFRALRGERPPVLGAFYLRDYCSDYCLSSNLASPKSRRLVTFKSAEPLSSVCWGRREFALTAVGRLGMEGHYERLTQSTEAPL